MKTLIPKWKHKYAKEIIKYCQYSKPPNHRDEQNKGKQDMQNKLKKFQIITYYLSRIILNANRLKDTDWLNRFL